MLKNFRVVANKIYYEEIEENQQINANKDIYTMDHTTNIYFMDKYGTFVDFYDSKTSPE